MKAEKTSPTLPVLVAHRGASHRAPENTLESYRLAWEEGARWIEGDFQLTADREIVCIHDPDTGRIAPGQDRLIVADASLAELQRLDAGSWKAKKYAGANIPTLKEILAEMPSETGIYMEVKDETPEFVPILRDVLAQSPVADALLTAIAFSTTVISRIRRTCPAIRTLLLCERQWDEHHQRIVPTVEELLTMAADCNAHGLGVGNSPLIDGEFVQRLREAYLEFHVWTVNNVEDALRYIELGVDSLTTDRPQGLREELLAAGIPQV